MHGSCHKTTWKLTNDIAFVTFAVIKLVTRSSNLSDSKYVCGDCPVLTDIHTHTDSFKPVMLSAEPAREFLNFTQTPTVHELV